MSTRLAPLLLFALLAGVRTAQAQADSTVFDELLFRALQGDMRSVLQGLDTLRDARLRPSQVAMKRTLQQRFATQNEPVSWPTNDTTLRSVITIYHRYWTGALLGGDQQAQDRSLARAVVEHLRVHVPGLERKRNAWLEKRWSDLLQQELKAHGCFAAVGRTGALYDLLLHLRETEVHYPVTTPEDTLSVKLVFMDSVISNGWEGYATADTYFPGGWATSDALYCVRSTYDLGSEQFAVSYLKHEGKHFADYQRFPHLQSPDLEYRAKLVELSAADSTLIPTIHFFLQNSAYDAGNPHAYANFCALRDLSRTLFNKEREEDINAWKALPVARIHAAAVDLLRRNTSALQAAGARSVHTLLR